MLSFYHNQNICDSISEATWTWQSYLMHVFCWFQRNKDDIRIIAQYVRNYRNWPWYGLHWSGLYCHSGTARVGPVVARLLALGLTTASSYFEFDHSQSLQMNLKYTNVELSISIWIFTCLFICQNLDFLRITKIQPKCVNPPPEVGNQAFRDMQETTVNSPLLAVVKLWIQWMVWSKKFLPFV